MNNLLRLWQNFSKVDRAVIVIAFFAVTAIAISVGQHIHFNG